MTCERCNDMRIVDLYTPEGVWVNAEWCPDCTARLRRSVTRAETNLMADLMPDFNPRPIYEFIGGPAHGKVVHGDRFEKQPKKIAPYIANGAWYERVGKSSLFLFVGDET